MPKTAIITGASGGVARAVAAQLRAKGYQLALVSRFKPRVTPEKDDRVIAADVSTPNGAVEAIAMAQAHFGKLPSALVHCAGAGLLAPLSRTSEAQYRQVMSANLDSTYFTLQAYLAGLVKSGQPGSAVLFSSTQACTGALNQSAVAASKGALEALARAAAAEYAPQQVRVNVIAAGMMRTPMTEKLLASERGATQLAVQYPLGRLGEAADAAAMAAWLVSDEAAWITGQTFTIDGGYSAIRPLVRAPEQPTITSARAVDTPTPPSRVSAVPTRLPAFEAARSATA